MKAKKPKKIWGNQVNLGGLTFKKPTRYTWHECTGAWWFDGNFSIEKLGLERRPGIVTFSSVDKKEVEIWTQGAIAFGQMIARFVEEVE